MASRLTCEVDIRILKMSNWRRIVIDSRYKTEDSISDTDFWVSLPYAVEIPKGSQLFVDGFSCSHSWPTIQSGVNDRVYVQEQLGAAGSHTTQDRIAVLSPGTYNATTLAQELAIQLNAASFIATVGGNSYQWTCSVDDGRILVQHNIPNSAGRGYLYSKEWTDPPATYLRAVHSLSNTQSLASANETLGFITNPNLSDQYIHSGQALTFSFMDLQFHKQIFLCANIGESSMQLLNGDTSCIARILVNTQQGDVITHHLSTGLSAVHFSSDEVMQRIRFQLKGYDGQAIHSGGHQVSFELIIQRPSTE